MSYPAKFAGLLAGAMLMASAAHAGDLTETNRATMQAFVDTLYGHKEVRQAYEAYVAPNLIQHNPNIADGREAAIEVVEGLLKNPDAHFDVKHLAVDGDMAAVQFRGSLGGATGASVTEWFRLENGKIVEHWDTFQVMDPKVRARNPHPYF